MPAGLRGAGQSHNAVAAAVSQGRADWGLAISTVSRLYGLEFIPYQLEHDDFVVPRSRLDRPAVRQFRELLDNPAVIAELRALDFER